MQHKIDYFSYSQNLWGKRETPSKLPPATYRAITMQHIPDYMPQEGWEQIKPRKMTVFGINYSKHCNVWLSADGIITVEHTGMGCLYLEQKEILYDVIFRYADQCTRIDIATDIYDPVRPDVFIEARGEARTRSYTDEKSDSGHTYYLGSKKSERFVRVYRYDGSHPRKDFLRIEYVYRNKDAKQVAAQATITKIADLGVSCGERYKWQHPSYEPHKNASIQEIRAWRPERRGGKTVYWLHNQVIPAIVKSVHKNEIDLEEFINAIRKAAQAHNTVHKPNLD